MSDAFDKFWAAWPTGFRVGKKPAKDVWLRKRLNAKADTLVADVERRQKEDDRWLRGFIPNPATYLRQERWEDEIVKPFKKPAPAQKPYTPMPVIKVDWEKGQANIAAVKASMRAGKPR